MVHDWASEQLAMLQASYPDWELWLVRPYVGPIVYCARPRGAPVATVNEDSPERLIAAIAEQEGRSTHQ